jgi:hypothetical protein
MHACIGKQSYSFFIPGTAAAFFPFVVGRYRTHQMSRRARGLWFGPVFLIDVPRGLAQRLLANTEAVPVSRN